MVEKWTDLYIDGRRLDSIIRQCYTKAKQNKDNPELYFSYVDRIIKATKTKVGFAFIILNVDHIIFEGNKKYGKPNLSKNKDESRKIVNLD